MRRTSFQGINCSVAQTLEVVGEWWTMLIIRDAFLGVTRFDRFQERLGISRNILTDRLDNLVEHGVLERQPYQENPVRYDYTLTEKGQDLWLVVTAMRQWGDKWEAPGGAPVVLSHDSCGHVSEVVPTCSHCGETIVWGSRQVLPGPGADRGPAPLPVAP
jgi:DNA-binding HxlR family transcriptional regulator